MTASAGPTVHVFGAGLSGLSAAVRLAAAGVAVRLYEAAAQAGGRCRSYHDRVLDRWIDNGNHLLLSGNRSALAYLDLIGARDRLTQPLEAAFPFWDAGTGERWIVRPAPGPLPWWLLAPARRIPGVKLREFTGALRLARADTEATVAETVRRDTALYRRFWEPLTLAALNAPPERASAQLLWAVLRESFARGGAACRPMIAKTGLTDALVDPALRFLAVNGGLVAYHQRLRGLEFADGRVIAADVGSNRLALGKDDRVILALPPHRLRQILPDMHLPADEAVILNAHFRLHETAAPPDEPHFLGLVNTTAQWVFVREDVASVTVSAADALGLADQPEAALLPVLWREVREGIGLKADTYATARLVKERRATFDASPGGAALRPQADIGLANLFLAGDFTATGLPASIESAIRSGETAARLAQAPLNSGPVI